MHLRRSMNHAWQLAWHPAVAIALAMACVPCGVASAQTSFVAPDGRNRFPAVTIFCPSGTGVAPCNFGGGSGSGASGPISLTFGGNALSLTNRLPVADAALDNLVTAGALSIGGTVAVSSLPSVSLAGTPSVVLAGGAATIGSVAQSGSWQVNLAGALPAGSNALGSVTVGNLPATQTVAGSVSVSNLPTSQPVTATALPLPAGAATDASVQALKFALGTPLQQTGGSVTVASLPPLSTGTNAIGSVSITNLPATQPVTATTLPLPAGAATDASVQAVKTALGTPLQQAGGSVTVASLPPLPAGSNAIGQVSVSNLPATQPVSAVAWPLPSGAATASAQAAPLAPVTPASATATNAVLLGCQASTTLPGFAAGQQGAVPCDTSGRLYVVTVPSANNVPAFLQAVTSGGATAFRTINVAASAMANGVKSGSGMLYGYEACNAGTSAAYFRLFALASAPTVGTSVPTLSKLLAAGTCQTMTTDIGVVFSTGIAMDVTAGSLADADTTTVASANQIAVSVYYK